MHQTRQNGSSTATVFCWVMSMLKNGDWTFDVNAFTLKRRRIALDMRLQLRHRWRLYAHQIKTNTCHALNKTTRPIPLKQPFTALFLELPRWGGTRMINRSGFCWSRDDGVAVASAGPLCKSFTPRCRQITMRTPHHSSFYGPDALPAAQPTAS